ncbi:MAG: MlaD family protein [Methylohalobius sp. ZOD2]
MGRESYALMAGIFVVVLMAAALAAFYWLGGHTVQRDPYIVVTQSAVSGLNPESTVYYRGVEAGKVTAVDFDPENIRDILIHIQVDHTLPITHGTYATLRSQPLTGLAEIELNDTGDNPPLLPTRADRPARIPMKPSMLDKMTESGQDILLQIKQLTTNLNRLLNAENRARIENTLAAVETAAEGMASLEGRLDQTVADLPALTAEARQTLARINSLALDFQEVSAKAKNLTEDARQLMASGQNATHAMATKTVPEVNALLRDLRPAIKHLGRLTRMLERDPQALLLGPPSPPPGPGEPGYEKWK